MVDVTKICSDLNELNPQTRQATEYLMAACKEKGLDIKIVETYRPQERQDWLYEQGRTRSGSIVTWTKKSQHTERNAVDFCHKTLGYSVPESFWRDVANLAVKIGFEAGYFWSPNQDKPHVQLNKNIVPKDILKEDAKQRIQEALNILVQKGVISSPDYWLNNYEKLQYLDLLIMNMAKALK